MTNELEKQFFDAFGIEPIEFKSCDVGTFCPYPEKECGTDTCPYYRTYKVDYPAISDSILLELICIRCKELISIIKVKGDNREELKNYILKLCIEDYTFYSKISVKTYNELANNFKHQVRKLFEEE